jgi:hypothetical protein
MLVKPLQRRLQPFTLSHAGTGSSTESRGGSMTDENDRRKPRVFGWTGVSIGNKYNFSESKFCHTCVARLIFLATMDFSVCDIFLYILEYKNEDGKFS